jgi:hypothetical protein
MAEFLFQDDAVKSIVGEDTCPTPAPIDAQAHAAFFLGKTLEYTDQ